MKPLICIDPGHGGKDSGAVTNSSAEKNWNQWAAINLRLVLTGGVFNYPIVLTRRHDIDLTLHERAEISDDAQAAALISLHHNAFTKTAARGIEIFYAGEDDMRLASAIWEQLKASAEIRGIPTRGLKPDTVSGPGRLSLLRYARAPACLIELGFITNPMDRLEVLEKSWHFAAANAIARGLNQFIQGY